MNITQEQVNQAQRQVMEQMRQNPQLQQALQQALPELMNDPDVTPESVEEVIRVLEFALQSPQSWPQLKEVLIKSGIAEPGDVPDQYDGQFIMVMLAALYTIREQAAAPRPFARGGLNAIRAAGRNGDTILAHISPFEDSILRAYGGSGRINPATGLPEYGFWKSLKKIVKVVAPIALAVLLPGLGAQIGTAIGMTGTAGAIAGNAILQGGVAALTGGDVGKAALMGGLSGGLGGVVGEAANKGLGLGLGTTGQAILGSGLVGGAAGAMTGQGFLPGAVQGAAGSAVGQSISGLGANFSSPAVQQGFQSAGQQYGNIMTAGYKPSEALTGSALAGITSGMTYKGPTSAAQPQTDAAKDAAYEARTDIGKAATDQYEANTGLAAADRAFDEAYAYRNPDGTIDPARRVAATADRLQAVKNLEAVKQAQAQQAATASPLQAGQQAAVTQAPAAATDGIGLNWNTLGKGLTLATLLGGASTPEQVQQQAATGMTPEQKEYFNRQVAYIDWGAAQDRAKAANLDLGSYVAQNWDKLGQEMSARSAEINPGGREYAYGLARGGALNRLAKGGGSGRADTIPARLSDGEYVIDAETVALLGDGSTDEGGRRLDQFRSNIRRQKGKSLARGKISPNARSPLAYLKGAA